MNAKVRPIPEGFHTVTPYLVVNGGVEALDFYQRAFGARERYRVPGPEGKGIGHAEISIGNSIVMLADECPGGMSQSPQTLGGSPVSLLLYFEDVDSAFDRAVKAGASVKEPLENKFYGERAGTVTDPFGHKWMLATHVEDVSPQELSRRMKEAFAEMSAGKGS